MKLAYCPECGAALSHVKGAQFSCVNNHDYWNNPKAAVTVIPINSGKVLLARRAHEPNKGKLDVIGGFLEPGETALVAAQREFNEETGVNVTGLVYVGSIANTYEDNNATCDSVFVVTDFEEQLKPGDDVTELTWHDPAVLLDDGFAWPAYHDVLPLIKPYLP